MIYRFFTWLKMICTTTHFVYSIRKAKWCVVYFSYYKGFSSIWIKPPCNLYSDKMLEMSLTCIRPILSSINSVHSLLVFINTCQNMSFVFFLNYINQYLNINMGISLIVNWAIFKITYNFIFFLSDKSKIIAVSKHRGEYLYGFTFNNNDDVF